MGKIVLVRVFLLLSLVVPILEILSGNMDHNYTSTRLQGFASKENGVVNTMKVAVNKEHQQTTFQFEDKGVKKMLERCDFCLYFFMYVLCANVGTGVF